MYAGIWTNDQYALLPINRPDLKPSTHGDKGWGWVSEGSYSKVMVRSSQGHSKVKSAENGWK